VEGFYQNTVALMEAIEDCLDKRRLLPCLALLYTGIDVMASLGGGERESTKKAFTRWVDSYMLKGRGLPCTALELYAARCGVVHTFTSDSELYREGKVRQIFYAWGTASAEDLRQASDILRRKDCVVVHIRDLIDAFRHGLADYGEEIERDPIRQQAVAKRAGQWFVNLQAEIVKRFLESNQDQEEKGKA
jgi:hypothetical protein